MIKAKPKPVDEIAGYIALSPSAWIVISAFMRKNVAPAGFACLPTPLNSKIKGETDSSGAGHGRPVRGKLFLYMANPDDPSYIPSYKFINSIGRLYKKRQGRQIIDRSHGGTGL